MLNFERYTTRQECVVYYKPHQFRGTKIMFLVQLTYFKTIQIFQGTIYLSPG